MAVEWVGLGLAIVKVALRLHDEPELADAIDDTTGGMRGLTTSWRKQRDLGTQIATSLRQEVLGQRGHNPPDDSEQEAAVGIATAVVSSLAGQAGALTEALVHPEQFHQFVLDHGGTAARAESVAERAEPLYDRILAVSCERIVMLAPTSRRAISATMAALLRSHEALSAELSEDVAETRAGVEELLDITRREQRPDRDRVEAVAASLPPYLAEEIVGLLDRVPQWADLAEALADSEAPARMLHRWATDPPPWLDAAQGRAWVLLGHALASYDAHEDAADAYQGAVRRGVPDPDHVDALAALALWSSAENASLPERLEERVATLLADNPCVLAQVLTAARAEDLPTACRLAVELSQSGPRDRERRAALMASTLIGCQRYPEAEQVLREHLSSAEGAGLHLMLSSRLCDDATHRRSTNRSAALLEAIELALTARQRRRAWGGDAVPPIAAAVEAAWALDDHHLVHRLVTPTPDGEATQTEAKDLRLLAVRAMAAANSGDEEHALQLAQNLDDFARLRVRAVCVTRRHGADPASEEVRAAWRAAWDVATNDGERVAAARMLLSHGGTAPGIKDLRRTQPAAMKEIDAITDAVLPRRGESTKARHHRLQKSARTNLHAGIELGLALAQEGKTRAAAKAWSDVADQFDDQRWRLQAAELLLRTGDLEATVTTVENALSRSTPGWPGRQRAHALAIEAAANDQDWDVVASHARQLLVLDGSPDVRWVLVHALCRLDELAAAWALVHHGDDVLKPVPGSNHRWQVRHRLELASQFGTREQLLRCAVEALRDYREDEKASAEILGSVYTSGARRTTDEDVPAAELPSPLADEFTTLSEQFQARFPDSRHFRALSFDPDHPEQLLAALTEQLAPRAAVLNEVEAKIQTGEFPVGALAVMTNRSYAESHLLHSSQNGSYLRRIDAATCNHEDDDLTGALAGEGPAALIDASAVHTLTWLSDQARGECLSALETRMTQAAFDDLRRARDALAIRSSGSFHYDTDAEQVVATGPDEQLAEKLAAAAAELVTLGRTLPRIRGGDDSGLQLPGSDARPWLGLISACRDRGLALWSDDVVLRDIARAEQVPAFGTYTLLARLHANGTLSPGVFEASLFDLTQHQGLDLPVQLERLRLVASIDRWRPNAAALVLTRPAAWATDPAACLNLLSEACSRRSTNPFDLAVWAARATQGLCTTIADPTNAAAAAAAMLARMLVTPNLTPEGARALLDGTRAATHRSEVPDPWASAVDILRDALLDVHSGEECRLILAVLAANLDQTDQRIVFRSLIQTR